VEPPEDIEVPKSLLGEEEVARLVAERRPAYVPLARGDGVSRLPPPDPATGPAAAPPPACAADRARRAAREAGSVWSGARLRLSGRQQGLPAAGALRGGPFAA
jgi:hypothetical protein